MPPPGRISHKSARQFRSRCRGKRRGALAASYLGPSGSCRPRKQWRRVGGGGARPAGASEAARRAPGGGGGGSGGGGPRALIRPSPAPPPARYATQSGAPEPADRPTRPDRAEQGRQHTPPDPGPATENTICPDPIRLIYSAILSALAAVSRMGLTARDAWELDGGRSRVAGRGKCPGDGRQTGTDDMTRTCSARNDI